MSNLLKHFMIKSVTPELQKEATGKSSYIKEPLMAAVIMLYVWKQYNLKLERHELVRLCSALCLPDQPKEEFLSFWASMEDSVSCLKK